MFMHSMYHTVFICYSLLFCCFFFFGFMDIKQHCNIIHVLVNLTNKICFKKLFNWSCTCVHILGCCLWTDLYAYFRMLFTWVHMYAYFGICILFVNLNHLESQVYLNVQVISVTLLGSLSFLFPFKPSGTWSWKINTYHQNWFSLQVL